MVHVMSEVHRYQVVEMLTEDGNKIRYSPTGPWVVMASMFDLTKADLDAQRLRADTAEADLKGIKEGMAYRGSLFGKVQAERDAAEQRIAEQNSLLEEMATEMTLAISDSQIRSAMTIIGRTRFLQILQAHNARIDAALNQKSEGESQ